MAISKAKQTFVDFRDYAPTGMTPVSGAAPAGTDNTSAYFSCGPESFEIRYEQASALIVPARATTGWVLPCDANNNDGIEMSHGVLDAGAECKNLYKVGTDPAFFFEVELAVSANTAAALCWAGFRLVGAYGDAIADFATLDTAYTDFAGLHIGGDGSGGAAAGLDIYTSTQINNAAVTLTDTTNNAVAGTMIKLRTNVSAAGVVTFKIDGANPTVNTNTVTLDTGDVMMPCLIIGAAGAGTYTIKSWAHGYQSQA